MKAKRQKLTQNIKNLYYSVYIHLNLDNNKRIDYIGILPTEKSVFLQNNKNECLCTIVWKIKELERWILNGHIL